MLFIVSLKSTQSSQCVVVHHVTLSYQVCRNIHLDLPPSIDLKHHRQTLYYVKYLIFLTVFLYSVYTLFCL